MGTVTASSVSASLGGIPAVPFEDTSANEPAPAGNVLRLDDLRQALAKGTRSTSSILHAVADATRVLTGADGTVLALHTKGKIVCRSRSGNIGPEIGTPLNTDSGISAECLRAGAVLVCHDALTDNRVDTEVCRGLGIRSVVVVPLRGAVGMAGILEAFSARPNAFDSDALHALRALAEIAESAHEREGRNYDVASLLEPRSKRVSAINSTSAVVEPGLGDDILQPHKKRGWIIAGIAIGLLLTFTVAWWSWHQPVDEIAAGESAARTVTTKEVRSTDPAPAVPKPGPGIVDRKQDRSRAGDLLKNAADIQPAMSRPDESRPAISLPSSSENRVSGKGVGSASMSMTAEPPPTIALVTSTSPGDLTRMTSVRTELPTLSVTVSQGVIAAKLLSKVEPVYPAPALMHRLSGKVTIEATIGEDGSVHDAKVISGPPILADAARTAIQRWRYSPALLNGNPVKVQKQITIVFTLP